MFNTTVYGKEPQSEGEKLYNKGTVFFFGYGDHEVDKLQACRYFLDSAKLEYPEAAYNLGHCHRSGDIGRVDLVLAKYWYEVALNRGVESAGVSLGILLLESGDLTEAARGISLITEASNVGDKYAQMYLAMAYLIGDHLNQDIDAALCLLHKASLRGNPLALGFLRLIFKEELYGVQTDSDFLFLLKERLRSIPMNTKLTSSWTYEKAIEHLFHLRPDIEASVGAERLKKYQRTGRNTKGQARKTNKNNK